MSDAETLDRYAAMLAHLADAAERLAMKHVDRAMAAEDPAVEAQATVAFQRAARTLRQCVALDTRLRRDRDADGRAARKAAARAADAQVSHRKAHLRAAVTQRARAETADDEAAEKLCDELDDLIDLEAFSDDFLREPAAAQVARLCGELELDPGPDLGAAILGAEIGPPAGNPAPSPGWESSA